MKPFAEALLDSNVVIAALAEEHDHHGPSAALFADGLARRYAIAAHSFAEVFVTLTRRGPRAAFGWSAVQAAAMLESVAASTQMVGLSPAQTFDAIRRYAGASGVGPRLYDHLIGMAAVQYGIPRIVTWNLRHMRDLFPALDVVDPVAALAI